jgi:hypothetical protein
MEITENGPDVVKPEVDKTNPCGGKSKPAGAIYGRLGGIDLYTLHLCRHEKPNEIPTVDTNSPLFISHNVGGVGKTEYTQAIFTLDEVLSVSIPFCLGWPVVNQRKTSSEWRFIGQL